MKNAICMKTIAIIVTTQNKYRMPHDDIYIPLQVGAKGAADIGYARDDTGENISLKNANYCELTGLYWAWKNLDADYIGIVQYRRYFASKKGSDKWKRIASGEELLAMLQKTEVILPKKRDYFIETTYSQYIHAHHAADLDTTREILAEKYPDYIPTFDSNMKKTAGHKFNMFIMRKDILDAYCEWLFSVLFELETRLDISGYSPYNARVFGFVAERLLDIWIDTNKIAYVEMPVIYMEKQNWLIKGSRFLLRKFGFGREISAD